MPALVVKLLMGQMGEELLLAGKQIRPKKAVALRPYQGFW
jgi:NAD dependent epimerase/dehydratase family enzyme